MVHQFDLRINSGETIGEIIMQPLLANAIEPVVVDVGARNGMSLLPGSYTRYAKLVGFEPNKAEYQKLVDGSTDAVQAGLPSAPKFKSEEYFNCAVWNQKEQRDFFVTIGPGACTLMGEANEKVTGRIFLDYADDRSRKTYSELHTRVVSTNRVDCRPLDGVLGEEKVDFLKLDAEGGELRILKGAEKLLASHRVLFIMSEFVCLPYYREHPVFGEQHALLNDSGYRLLDADFEQPKYSRTPTCIPASVDRRLKYAGDAYYAVDPDRLNLAPNDLQRLAAIALIFGFRSFCVSLLRDAGILNPVMIDDIEAVLSRIPRMKRFKLLWDQVPYTVHGKLAKIMAFGSR